MTEPLSDRVLAEIRASYPIDPGGRLWHADDAIAAFGHVEILLTEVERLRELLNRATKFTFGPSGPYDHPHAAIDIEHDQPEGSEDVHVLARPGLDPNAAGILRWSVGCAGWMRTHGGRWVPEPNPSDRTDKYLRATRWPTRDAALAVAEQLVADGHPDSDTWARGRRFPMREENLDD